MDNKTQTMKKVMSLKNIIMPVKSLNQLNKNLDKTKPLLIQANNCQRYEIIVQSQNLETEIKHIQWRSKTQFPIVKILYWTKLQKKFFNQCIILEIALDVYTYNLNTIQTLPFNQMIYVIKQSFIGFQRLYDKFGPFQLSPKLILINKNNKCKVWINQNLTLNVPSKRVKFSEHQFLKKIITFIQVKTIESSISNEFFKNITKNIKLLQAIQFIDSFAKKYKIIIPNRLILHPSKIVNEPNEQINSIRKYGYMSLKTIPNFLPEASFGKTKQAENKNKSNDQLVKKQNKLFKKDLSVNKLVGNKEQNKEKSQNKRSFSPISVSPKSQIKIEKEIKSKPLKRFLSSEDNPYATMVPISRRPSFLGIQEQIKTKNPSKYKTNQDINILKIQPKTSPNQASQKFITNTNLNVKEKCFNHKDFKNSTQNVQKSVISSQYTATTLQQYKIVKTKPELSKMIEHAPKIHHLKFENIDIFQKNGWSRRINNLTNNPTNVRETIQSQNEGQDTFSDTFSRIDQPLNLLGTMCKQLKKSIIKNDENN